MRYRNSQDIEVNLIFLQVIDSLSCVVVLIIVALLIYVLLILRMNTTIPHNNQLPLDYTSYPYKTLTSAFHGRELKLHTHDYQFLKVISKSSNCLIYEVEDKSQPSYMLNHHELKLKYDSHPYHPKVIKAKKISNNEKDIYDLAYITNIRLMFDNIQCPILLKYDQDGIVYYGQKYYYLCLYDDPSWNLDSWIMKERINKPFSILEAYRLLRCMLESFVYLEKNDLVLTKLDGFNIFAGSEYHQRFNQFRLNFKGYTYSQDRIYDLSLQKRFLPPEKQVIRSYKPYVFSLGLILIWCVLTTNSKSCLFKEDFQNQINKEKLKMVSQITVDLLLGKKEDNSKWFNGISSLLIRNIDNSKQTLVDLLNHMLEHDETKRWSPNECLNHKFFQDYQIQDKKEYIEELKSSKIE